MVELTVKLQTITACELQHPEGHLLRTDAPRDIGGDATGFSPTDLVAAGLASCILTTMSMFAKRHGVDLSGTTARVEKHMSQPPAPRRIARLPVEVTLPLSVPEEFRERLERVGYACPVHASLHPDVDAPITFRYL